MGEVVENQGNEVEDGRGRGRISGRGGRWGEERRQHILKLLKDFVRVGVRVPIDIPSGENPFL